MLKKRELLGDKFMFLGINKDGEKVYLQKPSWDCDWYWGCGYVVTCPKYGTPLNGKGQSFYQFNYLFSDKNSISLEDYEEYFTEQVLTQDEIWQFLELINTMYILRKTSDLLHLRGSGICPRVPRERELLDNDDFYEKINKIILPGVFEEIEKLLTI